MSEHYRFSLKRSISSYGRGVGGAGGAIRVFKSVVIYNESVHVRAFGLDETNVGFVGSRRNARTCTDSL